MSEYVEVPDRTSCEELCVALLHVDVGETTKRCIEGRAYPPKVDIVNPKPMEQRMRIMNVGSSSCSTT
eukprot:4198754-Amphidinium_carterae.2